MIVSQALEPLREGLLQGRATPRARVIIRENYLDFTWLRTYITWPATLSDAIMDEDGPILLGDTTDIIFGFSVWNPGTWGGNNTVWYYRYGNASTGSTLIASTRNIRSGSRPGLHRKDGAITQFRLFYIGSDNYLKAMDGSVTAGTPTIDTTVLYNTAMPQVADGMAVLPISNTECFVIGYTAPVMWIQYYAVSGGVFVAGDLTTLYTSNHVTARAATIADASLHPRALAVGDAHPDSYKAIVVFVGPDGTSRSLVYDKLTDTYGMPRQLISTPGSDFLRRNLAWSLAYSGGRLFAVMRSTMVGDSGIQYAGVTNLISTYDGLTWRDHGYITNMDIRGKAFVASNALHIHSPFTYGYSPTIQAVGHDPYTRMEALTGITSIALKREGSMSPGELVVDFTDENYVLPAKASVTYQIGDGTNWLTQFFGDADVVTSNYSLAERSQTLVARGSLSRLLGETAYTPLSSIQWRGQRYWHSDFHVGQEPVLALAVKQNSSNNTGYWYAEESDRTTIGYHVKCETSGIGLIPEQWEHDDLYARMLFSTDKDAGFIVYVKETNFTDYWRMGVIGGELVIGHMVAGTETKKASASITNWTAGATIRLEIHLLPGKMELLIVGSGDPATWDRVSYTWPVNGTETYGQSGDAYAVGIFTDLDAGDYTYLYQVWAIDGNQAENLGGILKAAGDLASVDITVASTSATEQKLESGVFDVGPLTVMPQTLRIFGQEVSADSGIELILYSTYAILDGYTYPYLRPISAQTCTLRFVIADDFISIYDLDRLLVAMLYYTPEQSFTVRALQPQGGTAPPIVLSNLYQPARWIIWDSNQNIAEMLNTLLTDRRVYLIEKYDGSVVARTRLENGDVLLGETNPIGSIEAYRIGMLSHVQNLDARNLVAYVCVVTTNGERVYTLDSDAAKYTNRIHVIDSQHIGTVAEALQEAARIRNDFRKNRDAKEVTGIPDIFAEIGDEVTIELGSGATPWAGVIETLQYAVKAEQTGISMQSVFVVRPKATELTTTLWSAPPYTGGATHWG